MLGECNVQLYRQMGTVRDELAQHEKALDHLIDLLKSEKVGDGGDGGGVVCGGGDGMERQL